MEDNYTWAFVDSSGVVISVQVASQAWVDAWTVDNTDTPIRLIRTDPSEIGYAGIGYEYEESTGKFLPPLPTDPGDWLFDRDKWTWIDSSVPVVPREVLEN